MIFGWLYIIIGSCFILDPHPVISNMSVSYSSLESEDSVEMTIYNFVVNYTFINDPSFVQALEWASITHNILDSSDFLEFLAWWYSRNDFRTNIIKNSSFGVVQQFQGVLSEEESNYIDERSASWYGGISLRMFLRHLIERFPPRNTATRVDP